MNIIDKIRFRQPLVALPSRSEPPRHQPEMLYIGCIDARLDPIDDIGIEKGTALIFRNIGALVLKDAVGASLSDHGAISARGDIPPNVNIGAVLEFFLHHIPLAPGRLKHIVISGHTDCGGLKACQQGARHEHDHYLPLYLESLKTARAKVMEEATAKGWGEREILHALERESVRQSMHNLQSYPVVRQALEEGRLQVHGWVIDTATQRISEMDPKTLEFEPMATKA